MYNVKNTKYPFFLFNYIPQGVFLINTRFEVVFWNNCIETWTGIAENKIQNQIIQKFFPKFNQKSYISRINTVFKNSPPIFLSSELHHDLIPCPLENGQNRQLNITITPVPYEQENTCLALFLIEDITQLNNTIKKLDDYSKELKKAKEKAEESDNLKTAFLNNISHEVRTPLHGLLGFSEMLMNPKLSDKKKITYQNIIKQCGQQLLGIIEDIICFSRIETENIEINTDNININDLISELYYLFKPQSKNKKIELKISIDTTNEIIINTDEIKLKQVFSNLLNNAFKFTTQGCIEFGYKQLNHELIFFVKDTGIGIAKQYHKTIFERFEKVPEHLHLQASGTGLGLSICKNIIQHINGKIWLKSEPQKGTTFFFSIPIVQFQKNKINEDDELYEPHEALRNN